MFGRVYRISERFGHLLIKLGVWSGLHATVLVRNLLAGLQQRLAGSAHMPSDSAHAESQVRSLSGLITILLAAVSLLLFWATSPQARDNPIINLFATHVPPTPTPDSSGGQSSPALFATPNPALVNTGTLVFSMYAGGQEDLFALEAGQSAPIRLTSDPADDRYPAWSPDGQHIAFSSHRDGNWDLYILSLADGAVTRLTRDLAFEAKPSWSPDGKWLVYEAYYEENLDLYIVSTAGGQDPIPVTRHPAADFDPAWATNPAGPYGRMIAFVSRRDSNQQDIYLLSLDQPDQVINITNTPQLDESSPAWGPGDTLLAYSAVENGIPLVYIYDLGNPGSPPSLVGQGQSPAWSPNGGNLVFLTDRGEGSLFLTGQYGAWETSVQTFALQSRAFHPDWSLATLPDQPQGSLAFAATAPITPAYAEPVWPRSRADEPYRLINVPGVIADAPLLSDRVDASFVALKEYMAQAAGWDFLGRLGDVWWPRDAPAEPGQDFRNWHKAGRAFDIVQTYNQGDPAQIELVPYQAGPYIYWELYVRAAVQDGSLGEPLYRVPWDFAARFGGDLQAYEAGGRLRDAIPIGYYVNFTRAARVFGWQPVPSESTWRYNWPAVLYWQYERHDGLDWWTAMHELYSEAELQGTFFTPTPLPPSGPVTITPFAPEDTGTPGDEPTPTPTPTPSPTPPGSTSE